MELIYIERITARITKELDARMRLRESESDSFNKGALHGLRLALEMIRGEPKMTLNGKLPESNKFEEANSILDDQPTIGGWVPVTKDTMPKANQRVIATVSCNKPNDVLMGSYLEHGNVKEFYLGGCCWDISEVDAWMPSPEPYGEGSEAYEIY